MFARDGRFGLRHSFSVVPFRKQKKQDQWRSPLVSRFARGCGLVGHVCSPKKGFRFPPLSHREPLILILPWATPS